MITSRVNPRNTSRECHRCHAPVIRYNAGQAVEGYTPGAPLVLCLRARCEDIPIAMPVWSSVSA